MIVVDASAWLSVLLPADIHHTYGRAWAAMMRAQRTSLVAPAPFPAEVIGVLERTGNSPSVIDDAIATMTASSPLTLYPVTLELGFFAAEVARGTAVRGADAVYLALAAWLDVPLVTWDKQQRERGALFCRTMTPVEAMEMAE